ncbi:hypothetical protein FRC12_024550 [Ceratobasidium sp. 428]|nr:hypothetical protein FRC12_024550 [Ceratobasidium sp. 428]
MEEFSQNKFVKVTTPLEDRSVLLVELNRSPVNAFNQPFWEELGATFDKISRDGTIRAVVLASSFDKIFTAGLDLADTGSLRNDDDTDPAREALRLRDHVLEVDVGLAADIGTLARLPKITGNESFLRELALTAREFGPDEAMKLGMVSKVVEGARKEVVAAALDTARIIASKSPIATVGTKRILLHARDHSVEENLEYTATWNQVLLQSTDTIEAFKSFRTKQPPKFKPLPKL